MKFLFNFFCDMKIPASAIKEIVKAVLYALLGLLGGQSL